MFHVRYVKFTKKDWKRNTKYAGKKVLVFFQKKSFIFIFFCKICSIMERSYSLTFKLLPDKLKLTFITKMYDQIY